jgi:hypothetical protein
VAGKPKPVPSTVTQNDWHEKLRTAFTNSTSIVDCITKLEDKFKKTIWDGKVSELPSNVFTDYVDAKGTAIDWATLASNQASRFKAVEQVFLNCRTKFARFG